MGTTDGKGENESLESEHGVPSFPITHTFFISLALALSRTPILYNEVSFHPPHFLYLWPNSRTWCREMEEEEGREGKIQNNRATKTWRASRSNERPKRWRESKRSTSLGSCWCLFFCFPFSARCHSAIRKTVLM